MKTQLENLVKCCIDTPKNQYHIFNTLFSIPHFQYLIFKTTCYSKIRFFHEKNRQIEDAFAKSLFWRNFFVKMTTILFYEWIILTKFLHYDGFTKNVPILASENTALNSCSKPYDNWLCIPTCISILKISRWCCICTLINTGSTNRK